MKEVTVGKKDIFLYNRFLHSEELKNVYELSKNIKGKRIAFINSTEFGGGVAELFHSIVPLSRSAGAFNCFFKSSFS